MILGGRKGCGKHGVRGIAIPAGLSTPRASVTPSIETSLVKIKFQITCRCRHYGFRCRGRAQSNQRNSGCPEISSGKLCNKFAHRSSAEHCKNTITDRATADPGPRTGSVSQGPLFYVHRTQLASLCHAIVLPVRTLAFRDGCWPGCTGRLRPRQHPARKADSRPGDTIS